MRKYSGAPIVFSFSRAEAAIESATIFANESQVAAIGLNCMTLQTMLDTLPNLARTTQKPIFAYPNGGGTYDPETKSWSQSDKANWTEFTKICEKLNVKVRGGCCRTTPDDIKAIRTLSN